VQKYSYDNIMTDTSAIRPLILSSIRPSDKERRKLKTLAQRIIERVDNIGKAEGLNVNGILVGSSARGTWISGEHDLDIFIMFPPDTQRQYLEEKGLYIARKSRMKERVLKNDMLSIRIYMQSSMVLKLILFQLSM